MQGLHLHYDQVATSDREQEMLYLKKHKIHYKNTMRYQAGYLCSSHWDLPAPHHQSLESLHQAPAAEVLQGAAVVAVAVVAAAMLLSVDELAWKNTIHLK